MELADLVHAVTPAIHTSAPVQHLGLVLVVVVGVNAGAS